MINGVEGRNVERKIGVGVVLSDEVQKNKEGELPTSTVQSPHR